MLYNYNNLNRNNKTREIMLAEKKDYKYYCRSCKLKYSYEQGRKMNETRRKQPKQFWKIFKRNKALQCDDVSAWHVRGPEFDPHVRHILSWRLGHENISAVILPLPLIQEDQW